MLIIDKTKPVFNTEEIHRGTLVYARNRAWTEGISGFVTETSEKELRIQFLPAIQNVVSHWYVSAEDVADGLWTLRYSNDGMFTVNEYPEESTGNTEASGGDSAEDVSGGDGGSE